MNALDTATSFSALREAWVSKRRRLKDSCFGIDRVTGIAFERNLDRELREIRHRASKSFRPHDLLALVKPKPSGGARIICVPTIADRVLQFGLLNELRPRLAMMGMDNPVSYGLAQGAERSVLGARKFACAARAERPWPYKTDIQKFFDNIGRPELETALREVVRTPTLLPLLIAFVHTEIGDGIDPKWKRTVEENGIQRNLGVRQGMPLSPFFAGAYLRGLDRYLIKTGAMTARYVDDIISFFATEAEAFKFHWQLKDKLRELGLHIGNPGEAGSKTAVYAPSQPAEFLGMELTPASGGTYQLRVGQRTVDKLIQGISDACSPRALLDRSVSLTNMSTYFRSVQAGYLNAYGEAHNRDDLRNAMEQASLKAQRRVLEELFGQPRLRTLGPAELKFVGIDRLP